MHSEPGPPTRDGEAGGASGGDCHQERLHGWPEDVTTGTPPFLDIGGKDSEAFQPDITYPESHHDYGKQPLYPKETETFVHLWRVLPLLAIMNTTHNGHGGQSLSAPQRQGHSADAYRCIPFPYRTLALYSETKGNETKEVRTFSTEYSQKATEILSLGAQPTIITSCWKTFTLLVVCRTPQTCFLLLIETPVDVYKYGFIGLHSPIATSPVHNIHPQFLHCSIRMCYREGSAVSWFMGCGIAKIRTAGTVKILRSKLRLRDTQRMTPAAPHRAAEVWVTPDQAGYCQGMETSVIPMGCKHKHTGAGRPEVRLHPVPLTCKLLWMDR
ncbi:hypothetical protein BKA93DRAFT_754092 [Sparassis latifolia]